MARILIVEDESSMQRILSVMLSQDGHDAVAVASSQEAGKALGQGRFDLVLTDQRLAQGDGLGVLKLCRESDPVMPVIMLTAYATVDLAVKAMREGAFDFLTKPFEPETVSAVVQRALTHGALLRENSRLKEEVRRLEHGQTELLGNSSAIRQVREIIARVAPTEATVLITGETGTGKEVVARLIHQHSRRADKPFIAVNCAALPETLLESQLFGHERGAFTGAERTRIGLFEAAHGGTLFLDEAGEMPLSLQAKLLRVLMNGEVVRVGTTTPRHVDVRILAATHRDLRSRISEGQFREDLYYRLAVLPLEIAPLRERPEDVSVLAAYFGEIVARDLKMPRRRLAASATQKLQGYDFPGNVRELRNLIERAYILGRHDEITAEDIPLRGDVAPARVAAPSGEPLEACVAQLPEALDLRETLARFENLLLERALAKAEGSQAEAGRLLGLSRSDMNYKLKRLRPREGESSVVEGV